jgi:signal transduction histidine kinase
MPPSQPPPDDAATRALDALPHELLELLPVGLCLVDGPTGRIRWANAGYQRFAPGVTMQGQPWAEVWADAPMDMRALAADVLQSGEPFVAQDQDFPVRRTPGGPLEAVRFTWQVHRVTLPGRGAPDLLEICQETTEQVRTAAALGTSREEQGRLRAALTEARTLSALGTLAGGVAHELNNQLGVIQGYGELALTEIEPGSPLAHDLREMIGAARHAAAVTRQLLAFAQRQVTRPATVDIDACIEERLPDLRAELGPTVAIAWQPGAPGAPVVLDPRALLDVLRELCRNAREALGDRGTLTIETAEVTIDGTDAPHWPGLMSGDWVRVIVSDDGPGIPSDLLPTVFEPFVTTKDSPAAGLGLAVVHGLVHQAGGTVHATSRAGRGTTVTLHLPRRPATDTSEG